MPEQQLRMVLAAEPASASAARRFVREALLAAGRDGWVDRAELAVSELVTNAVLHAHSPVAIEVTVTPESATVNVRDNSPRLPAQRHWGQSATTGRGLALVASVTSSYGVETEPTGKNVWFRLEDTAPEQALDGVFDLWDLDSLLTDPEELRTQYVAALVGVPVLLWLAAQQHHEAVLRELYLIHHAVPNPAAPFDPGVVDTRTGKAEADTGSSTLDLSAAGTALAALSDAIDRAVAGAICTGVPLVELPPGHPSPLPAVPATVDALVPVTAGEHAGFAALQDALDLGVRLGAADRMLIRPALPETVALRDWACEQVVAQANGVPATGWSGVQHPRFTDSDAATAPAPSWDDTVVRTSLRPVVAADDNNRIVAVSETAAQLLGWPAAELAGRRVVTIVPDRLREAHVAGFTRHLTTGEAHVLGVPVDLPVLRRDGSQITCRFLIERAPASPGRAVYLAWLTLLNPPSA